MKKVLIAYFSRTGTTEKMAQLIAEGVRMGGCEVELTSVSKVSSDAEIIGYDGYVFGCPTYHKDMTNNMKQFLFLAERANLIGKIGGAFGSHTHSGESAPMIPAMPSCGVRSSLRWPDATSSPIGTITAVSWRFTT